MSIINYCNSNHILVGLGGTGGKILRAFKMRLFEEFPTEEDRRKLPVSLLYVDSTEEMMPQDGKARADFRVMGQDASFTRNEFLNIKAVDVEHILDHINNYPSVKGIVDNVTAVKSAIGSLGQAAGQKGNVPLALAQRQAAVHHQRGEEGIKAHAVQKVGCFAEKVAHAQRVAVGRAGDVRGRAEVVRAAIRDADLVKMHVHPSCKCADLGAHGAAPVKTVP